MKVVVDQDKCVSSGQCVLFTAQVFDQRDEDGIVTLLNDSPPPSSTRRSATPPRCARRWPSP